MGASIDTTLAWAMPVKADLLTAHLEAYIDTLPSINTLRLCNRYGQGPEAAVTRLPIELVQRIEDYITIEEREVLRKARSAQLRCYEGDCETADHFSEEEMHQELNSYLGYYSDYDSDDSAFADLSDPSPETLRRFINTTDDEWVAERTWDRCCDNAEEWKAQEQSLNDRASFLRKHFGLDPWTSTVHVHRPKPLEQGKTTVAFLALSGASTYCDGFSFSRNGDDDNEFPSYEDSYIMPVDLRDPGQRSLARFQRALKILQLEVFEHPSQSKRALAPIPPKSKPEDDVTATDMARRTWPRLTVLVRGYASLCSDSDY